MQDAIKLDFEPTDWHRYAIDWQAGQVSFRVDGSLVFATPVSPLGRLGLVIWIDNQYLSLSPSKSPGFGLQSNQQEAWIEIKMD